MLHQVTKKIEIDYGHTLPEHYGFCNQIHGHRGVVEVTVTGPLDLNEGRSSQGMVMDFSILKKIMMEKVHAVLDHGFAIWEKDTKEVMGGTAWVVSTLDFIRARNKKVLILNQPPTAEVLAKWAFEVIQEELRKLIIRNEIQEVILDHVVWHETPNSWARYPKGE